MNTSILIGLTKAANHFVTKMKDKISQNRLPNAISDATSIGTAQANENGGEIVIKIDLKTAPMAAAFEWGSGLHDPRGAKLIPIETTKYPSLVFFWEKGGHWWRGPKLTYGHPGVAPRPYIQPTLIAEMPEIKKIVGQEVKAAILIGLTEKFKT